jgi:hypothetical protein
MSPSKIKELAASIRQYGAVRTAKLVSRKAGTSGEVCTIRMMLGETAFIVTALVTADNRLDDLKFIEE